MASDYIPQNYGAAGNGTTDDSAAIQALINSMPYDATLRLTSVYLLASPVTITTPINIQGSGAMTGFIIKHSTTTNPGLTIGSQTTGSAVDCRTFRDFGIYGKDGSCRNGLAIYNVTRSSFENIYVRPGSAANAVLIAGCQDCKFDLTVTTNPGYAVFPTLSSTGVYVAGGLGVVPGGWKGAGVFVGYLGDPALGNAEPTAACQFNCIVEGGGQGAGGFAVSKQTTGSPSTAIYLQGTNEVRGVFQGFSTVPVAEQTGEVYGAGYSIRIDGCDGFTVHNVHAEDAIRGARITASQRFAVRDSLLQGGTVSVEGCGDFTLDRLYVTGLNLASCFRYRLIGVDTEANVYHELELSGHAVLTAP